MSELRAYDFNMVEGTGLADKSCELWNFLCLIIFLLESFPPLTVLSLIFC